MSEARRTLGCWLLAAFLGRGCDPTTERVAEVVPRERNVEPASLGPRRPVAPTNVVFLPGPWALRGTARRG